MKHFIYYLFILAVTLASCNLIKPSSKDNSNANTNTEKGKIPPSTSESNQLEIYQQIIEHKTPDFYEVLNSIKAELNYKKTDYIIYSSILSNCHSDNFYGYVKAFWNEGDQQYCRILFSENTINEIQDSTALCDFEYLKQQFVSLRLDTVRTLPHGNEVHIPATTDKVHVNIGNLKWESSFEHTPLITSVDTTHIMYNFLEDIIRH
jgi:hypothetical protein